MNKSIEKNKKGIRVITTILGIVLMGIIVVSVVFFRGRLRETKKLLDSSEYETYDNYYVMITENRDSDYWKSIYDGALEEAKKNNAYVKLMGADLEDEFSKEDLLRMAIASKVDGIIVEGDNVNKNVMLLKEADAAGIPVVTVEEDNTESQRKSFIGVSGYNMGRDYGEQICSYVKEAKMQKCNVLVLVDNISTSSLQSNVQTSTTQSIVITAIKEMIDYYGLSSVISLESKTVTSNIDFAAEEEIRDIFVGQETLPNVIVCLSEKSTMCVSQAVVDYTVDYTKDSQVEIFGYYLSPSIEAAIRKNTIRSSIVVDTKQMGEFAVRALNEYKESGYVSDYNYIDTSLVTKESLDSAIQEGGDEDDQEAE